MSTSPPGSDTTSQDAAYMRIQELERQLFVVNKEKRKEKLDFEVEIIKLRDEIEARKAEASYEIRKATNESDALKQKLATLNAQLAAKGKEHPEEDIASEGPVGSSESPLGDAGLQAEIEHLKAQKKRYLDEVMSLRKEVTEKHYRLYNAKADLKELRMYTKGLEEQNDILRTKHQATRELLNTSAENLTTGAERAFATSYNLAQIQQKFVDNVSAEFEAFHEVTRQAQKTVASAKKVTNLCWQEVEAQVQDLKYNSMRSEDDEPALEEVDKIRSLKLPQDVEEAAKEEEGGKLRTLHASAVGDATSRHDYKVLQEDDADVVSIDKPATAKQRKKEKRKAKKYIHSSWV